MSAFRPRKSTNAVNFYCTASQAEKVTLIGDFNDWNPDANPMEKRPDGTWGLTVELTHGHHRYAFLVDDVLTLDPNAQGITRNDEGQRVCLIPVSGF